MSRQSIVNANNDKRQVLDKIGALQWKHWLNRPYNPFWATFAWPGLAERYFKKAGFDNFCDGSHLYQYPDMYYSDTFERKSDLWAKKFFANYRVEALTTMLEKTHARNMRELDGLLRSNDDIRVRINKFFEACRLYIPYLWLVLPIENYFNEQVEKKFKKHFPDDYKKIAADFSTPKKKSAYEKMLELLDAGVEFKKVRDEYGWLKSRDGFSAFYSIKDLKEIKKNHLPAQPGVSDIRLPRSLESLVEDLRELTFFRTDRTDKFYEHLNAARPLFREMAKAANIPYPTFKYYDALLLLKGVKKKHKKDFSYALYDNKYVIQDGKLYPDLNKHDTDEVKGHIAFMGVARGRAKIITHPSELKKVTKGDILVTQMTFPSFISAMQKAAAFVTDEGGITCHAAIVAREMKKPCIIATKNATKALKDGDMVEVDANIGTVKIIKKQRGKINR